MTSVDIELLKSSAANEDLSQALLMDNYRTDDVFDLNIGVHGNFDDFSYDHSRRGKAFHFKAIFYITVTFYIYYCYFFYPFLCFCSFMMERLKCS